MAARITVNEDKQLQRHIRAIDEMLLSWEGEADRKGRDKLKKALRILQKRVVEVVKIIYQVREAHP
jgi:hypothetical protein